MDIKRNVQFQLRGYRGKQVKYQIRMRVTYSGMRFEYATQSILLSKDAWDEEAQRVKVGFLGAKNESAGKINGRINLFRNAIDECFKYFEVNKIIPSVDELKKRFEDTINPTSDVQNHSIEDKEGKVAKKTFWSIYEEFMTECSQKNDWTLATTQKFNALKHDLTLFNKNVDFDFLTESGLTKFLIYLREEKKVVPPKSMRKEDGTTPGERFGILNSTIDKKFVFLSWFLNWATKKCYNTNMAFREFKPALKTAAKPVIYLTEEEMVKIRDLELKPNQQYLDRVRDVFRFCCFTGIRYSDANNLRRSNIKDDHIEIITIKTTDTLNIPLSKSAKAILDKYAAVPFENDKALPVITNQKMNLYLKELCKLAGVDTPCTITIIKGNKREDIVKPKHELVGTHTGRRTFVTLALSKGVSAEVVMKITGHKSYNTMKPYIAIAKEAKQKAVDALADL